jgi:hypothetical protein
MKIRVCAATGLLICMTATASSQESPGFGASSGAAEAMEHLDELDEKPSGFLMNFAEAEVMGMPERTIPGATGRYPVVDHPVELSPLFSHDPAKPLQDLFDSIRKDLLDRVSLTFEPMAAWTYQNATKVVDGAPHAKSLLWEAFSTAWTMWHRDGDYGQIIFVLQNNVGVGTPLLPFMGPGVGDPTVVNNILVGPGLTTNLYWQQSLFHNSVRVRVGKISDSTFFDRNAVAYDPIQGFMSLDFNQSLTNPFPSRGFGGVMSVDVTDNLTIRGGTLNSASAGITSGFDGLGWSHLFSIVEGDLRVFPEIGGQQREGHVRLMAWYNAIPNPVGLGNTGGAGVTLNMDQALADHTTAFMRAGWGQNDVTVSNFAVSAGVAMSHPFGLKSCQTGVAVEYAKITQLGRQASGLVVPPGEHYMLEWYWRVQVSKSTSSGPVIQVVRDAAAGIDTSVIWGWRTTVGF